MINLYEFIDEMTAQEIVPCGKYRHYKGKIYEVIGTSIHTETLEELILYKDEDGITTWARPVKMWYEPVQLLDGRTVPRFTRIEEIKNHDTDL